MVPFWKQSERLNNREIIPYILYCGYCTDYRECCLHIFQELENRKNSIEADAVVSRIHIDDRTGGS